MRGGGKPCMLYEKFIFICFKFLFLRQLRPVFYKIKNFVFAFCKIKKFQILYLLNQFISIFNKTKCCICCERFSNECEFVLLEKGSVYGAPLYRVVNFN